MRENGDLRTHLGHDAPRILPCKMIGVYLIRKTQDVDDEHVGTMRGVVGSQSFKITPAWEIAYAHSVVDEVQSVGLDRVCVLQRREDLDAGGACAERSRSRIRTAARGQAFDALDEA